MLSSKSSPSVLTKQAKGHLITAGHCGLRDRNEDEAAVMLTTAATMKTKEKNKDNPSLWDCA